MSLTLFLATWAAVLGALIGSFLNVVIYRVPAGLSIVRPPSACPGCKTPISARDNVPVLSWLALRGRCRSCAEPISRRYPAVELLTAVLFVAVVLRFASGTPADLWAVPAFWVLAGLAVSLSAIDLDVQRLPDPIVFFGYAAGGGLLVSASLLGAGDGTDALIRAAIGGVGMYVFHFVLMFAWPAGMGFGDVKLSLLTGMFLAWLGWGPLAVGVTSSYVLGVVFAAVLAATGHKTKGIPFGPSMFAGVALGVAFGEPLWAAYLTTVGL